MNHFYCLREGSSDPTCSSENTEKELLLIDEIAELTARTKHAAYLLWLSNQSSDERENWLKAEAEQRKLMQKERNKRCNQI